MRVGQKTTWLPQPRKCNKLTCKPDTSLKQNTGEVYTILTECCSLSHLLNSYRKGKQYVNRERYLIFNLLKPSRTASSVNFWLCSFLCGNRLYLLSVFLHSSILFIVFVGFLSILLRHSTFQPNFCGYYWSFPMLEAVFSISHWIVAKQLSKPLLSGTSHCVLLRLKDAVATC